MKYAPAIVNREAVSLRRNRGRLANCFRGTLFGPTEAYPADTGTKNRRAILFRQNRLGLREWKKGGTKKRPGSKAARSAEK
jgi:hypothetical protein